MNVAYDFASSAFFSINYFSKWLCWLKMWTTEFECNDAVLISMLLKLFPVYFSTLYKNTYCWWLNISSHLKWDLEIVILMAVMMILLSITGLSLSAIRIPLLLNEFWVQILYLNFIIYVRYMVNIWCDISQKEFQS